MSSSLKNIRMLVMHDLLSDEFRSFLLPLEFFYAKKKIEQLDIFPINSEHLPELERNLLAHDVDMTSTLSKYHNSDLYVEVLDSEINENYILRMVVLKTSNEHVPVEFGAIGIDLDKLPSKMAIEISDKIKPLGKLLEEHKIDYISNPRGYFKLKSDNLMSEILKCPLSEYLYGRCNKITDNKGYTIADIVEVLPCI